MATDEKKSTKKDETAKVEKTQPATSKKRNTTVDTKVDEVAGGKTKTADAASFDAWSVLK